MATELINVYHVPLKRKCSQCGRSYFRRNLVETWTGRNIGKRYGWTKDTAKVCLNCMDIQESKKILGIADVQFTEEVILKRRKVA